MYQQYQITISHEAHTIKSYTKHTQQQHVSTQTYFIWNLRKTENKNRRKKHWCKRDSMWELYELKRKNKHAEKTDKMIKYTKRVWGKGVNVHF